MKQSTKNILVFIGGFIWAMKSTTKAYAPTIIKIPPSPPQNPTSPEYVRPVPSKRNTALEAKIKQVGNWMPNDTSCTPCTTMNYQGGRGTARIHKSWCDINCTAEVRQANKLRNPFGHLYRGPSMGLYS